MYPTNLKYSKDHEWIMVEGKTAKIGITKYAVDHLGDIVFVDMPKPGSKLEQGKTLGVVESVKTVSDMYSPASGKVVHNNEELESDPSLLNQDPYGKAWIVEIELANPAELDALMDAKEYEKHCASQAH